MDRIAEARRNIAPTAPVCRCLFGPLDRDHNRQFMKDFNAQQTQEITQQYNFDFHTESPLKGKYDWVKVSDTDQENVPQAYRLPQLMAELNTSNADSSLALIQDTKASVGGNGQSTITGTEGRVHKPVSQRALVFSQEEVASSTTEQEPVVLSSSTNQSSLAHIGSSNSSENSDNKELQCNTRLILLSPQTDEATTEAINNLDADVAAEKNEELRNDLSDDGDVTMATESTPRKRKQRTIPDFFCVRKKNRQEEKTD